MKPWGLIIWVFFPIPILSLVLLSIPAPARLVKFGNDVVHRIFFTRVTVGPIKVRLLDLFFVSSLVLLASCVHTLTLNKSIVCSTCRYESETYWYKKAMKFRSERNFWLSLFNTLLWLLVWRLHSLQGAVLKRQDRVRELEAELKNSTAGVTTVEVRVPKKTDEEKKKE